MKTLYLDCGMGAAGDMLMAALLELCPEKREEFLEKMNRLGLPGIAVKAEEAVKCGITGTHVEVTYYGEAEESVDAHGHEHYHDHDHDHHDHHDHDHHDHDHDHHDHDHHDHDHHGHDHHDHDHDHHDHDHHGHDHHDHGHHHADMAGIAHIISHLELPEKVKADMEAVYTLIAEAEGKAHGKPVEQIHFHEVGTADAIADIAGVCLLMHELNPDRVLATPVHVGSGHVHCAHGILPVPAPATAHILRDVPIYGGQVKGELCTPTGAALLKHFVTGFGEMPPMAVEKIGYGMGTKDFPQANCVRAMLGETSGGGTLRTPEKTPQAAEKISQAAEKEEKAEKAEKAPGDGEIVELSCNLDDMTAEAMGFAQEMLFEAGALEVYTMAVGMKKNRPGILLTCLCREEDREKMVELLFKHTTTLGIRENLCRRYTLTRSVTEEETAYGIVRKKVAAGYGVRRSKAEYEDLARIARENGMSLREVEERIR